MKDFLVVLNRVSKEQSSLGVEIAQKWFDASVYLMTVKSEIELLILIKTIV